LQLFSDTLRAQKGLVDNNTSIDNKEDTPWCLAYRRCIHGFQCEVKDSYINDGSLACRGRYTQG
jgi:hypothetical protein